MGQIYHRTYLPINLFILKEIVKISTFNIEVYEKVYLFNENQRKRDFEKKIQIYANNQSIDQEIIQLFNQQRTCHPTNSNEITIPVSFNGK